MKKAAKKPSKKLVKKIKSKPKKPAKKKVKAKAKPNFVKVEAGKKKPIGKVTHYFDHIKVGVIKLLAPMKVGDEIRIMGGESTDFNQVVKSMQQDHKEIKAAKKGKSIGLKVKEKVREGYRVYKA